MLKTYEAMFIFPTSLKDEAIEAATGSVRAEMEKLGGVVKETITIGRRTFARPMDKRDAGIYIKMICDLEPSSIDPLLARFKLNEDVFRVQIVLEPNLPEPYEKKEDKDGESE